MFRKLFNRTKARPVAPGCAAPAQISVAPKECLLDDFVDGWEDKWATSHEVVESNGSDTEWGLWTHAKKVEENSFAETVLEDDDFLSSTVPMPLGPGQV